MITESLGGESCGAYPSPRGRQDIAAQVIEELIANEALAAKTV
jgi:hypothetical protein